MENLSTYKSACRRELATLFAHIIYETGDPNSIQYSDYEYKESGLLFIEERGCGTENPEIPLCEYYDESTNIGSIFGYSEDRYYYGRGPIHLRWNGLYGRFSKSYYDDNFYGE